MDSGDAHLMHELQRGLAERKQLLQQQLEQVAALKAERAGAAPARLSSRCFRVTVPVPPCVPRSGAAAAGASARKLSKVCVCVDVRLCALASPLMAPCPSHSVIDAEFEGVAGGRDRAGDEKEDVHAADAKAKDRERRRMKLARQQLDAALGDFNRVITALQVCGLPVMMLCVIVSRGWHRTVSKWPKYLCPCHFDC